MDRGGKRQRNAPDQSDSGAGPRSSSSSASRSSGAAARSTATPAAASHAPNSKKFKPKPKHLQQLRKKLIEISGRRDVDEKESMARMVLELAVHLESVLRRLVRPSTKAASSSSSASRSPVDMAQELLKRNRAEFDNEFVLDPAADVGSRQPMFDRWQAAADEPYRSPAVTKALRRAAGDAWRKKRGHELKKLWSRFEGYFARAGSGNFLLVSHEALQKEIDNVDLATREVLSGLYGSRRPSEALIAYCRPWTQYYLHQWGPQFPTAEFLQQQDADIRDGSQPQRFRQNPTPKPRMEQVYPNLARSSAAGAGAAAAPVAAAAAAVDGARPAGAEADADDEEDAADADDDGDGSDRSQHGWSDLDDDEE